MPSLASVTFDASGFDFQGERDGAQTWYTPAGDGLGVFYFSLMLPNTYIQTYQPVILQ